MACTQSTYTTNGQQWTPNQTAEECKPILASYIDGYTSMVSDMWDDDSGKCSVLNGARYMTYGNATLDAQLEWQDGSGVATALKIMFKKRRKRGKVKGTKKWLKKYTNGDGQFGGPDAGAAGIQVRALLGASLAPISAFQTVINL